MNKKLIITEQQYKNLKFFLLESTFDEMAKNVIKKGDTITITTQGKKFNFQVVDNNGGQILMDVSDKDSQYFGRRAFLTFTSFNDNKLELNLASDKQKEENPPQVKTWAKWTLKDVEQIDVSRGGKIIDGTNYDAKSEEKNKAKSRFIESIATLGDGDAISLETDGKIGNIVLDFVSKSSGFVHFELSEKTKDALGNPNITGVDISLDENHIELTQNGLLDIDVVTYETTNGNVEKKESKIQNIADFTVTNSQDSEDSEESNDGDNEKRKSRFIETLSTLEEGDAIDLAIAGKEESIILDFMSKSEGFIHFELSEKTKDALGNPNITGVDIPLDENKIEVTKEGNLNIDIITYETKDGDVEKNNAKIQNISEVDVVDATNVKDDAESELDGQKIFDIITGDTELRNAFYKKPSFWRSFVGELKGEKPKTTGFNLVKNLIDNYMEDSAEKRVGKNFRKERDITLRPLDEVFIRYVKNGENLDYRINKFQVIDDMRYIGSKPSEDGEYNLHLTNKNIDIFIKEKTDKENVYICDIVKKYTETVTKDDKETEVKKYSKPAKDIRIEFTNSPGYKDDKDVVKK